MMKKCLLSVGLSMLAMVAFGSKPLLNARYEIDSVVDASTNSWRVSGTMLDPSKLGYSAIDVETNDLIGVYAQNYGDIDIYEITNIIAQSGNTLTIDVIYAENGSPRSGQPEVGYGFVCRKLTDNVGWIPSETFAAGIPEYLRNGARTLLIQMALQQINSNIFNIVTNHNGFPDLQGGAANDYYHFTLADYNALRNGTNTWNSAGTNAVKKTGDIMTGPLTNQIGIYGNGIGITNISYVAGTITNLINAYAPTGFADVSGGQLTITHGTSPTNADALGGVAAANYARTDINTRFYGHVEVGGGGLSPGAGNMALGTFWMPLFFVSGTGNIFSGAGEWEGGVSGFGNLVMGTETNASQTMVVHFTNNSCIVQGYAKNVYENNSLVNDAVRTDKIVLGGTNLASALDNRILRSGDTITGALYSTAPSASTIPAQNEIPVAGWVRNLFNVGIIQYLTTNLSSQNSSFYSFYSDTQAVGSVRTYNSVTNTEYIGTAITTSRYARVSGQVAVNAYMGKNVGSVTIHPEIYFSYDGTNLFGDYVSQGQSISTGSNLYQWVITVPEYMATNNDGIYVVRRFKVDSQVSTPNISIYMGGSTPSHISLAVASSFATMESATNWSKYVALQPVDFDYNDATNVDNIYFGEAGTPIRGYIQSIPAPLGPPDWDFLRFVDLGIELGGTVRTNWPWLDERTAVLAATNSLNSAMFRKDGTVAMTDDLKMGSHTITQVNTIAFTKGKWNLGGSGQVYLEYDSTLGITNFYISYADPSENKIVDFTINGGTIFHSAIHNESGYYGNGIGLTNIPGATGITNPVGANVNFNGKDATNIGVIAGTSLQVTGGSSTSESVMMSTNNIGQTGWITSRFKLISSGSQTTNTANLVITGVGFKPVGATVFANMEGKKTESQGFIDSAGVDACMVRTEGDLHTVISSASFMQDAGAKNMYLDWVSWDTDGATFTRTRDAGIITNNVNYKFLFYR